MKAEQLSRELVEVRSRLSLGAWDGVRLDVGTRLASLHREVEGSDSPEMFRHAPVAAIAALQTHFRGVVVDLVNRGDPYRSRVADLVKDKIAVGDAISWFHGDSFTFGEVIARSAGCNSVAHILSWLGTLLNVDLKNRLRDVVDPYARRHREPNTPRVISDVDELLRDVEEVFRARHILAHEAAARFQGSRLGALRAVGAVQGLIAGIEAVLWETAYADLPITQFEMTEHAARSLEDARVELRVVAGKAARIAARDGVAEWFAANQISWEEACKEWIEVGYLSQNGTMWPAVAGSEFATLVRQRTEQLKRWASSRNLGEPDAG